MKDDWVRAALSDDRVVVELLFRLKQQQQASSELCSGLHLTLNGWGHRQARSKPCSSVKKASTTTTRFSPRTPLSWSGDAASPSDGGYVESSRPPSSDLSSAFRSKGTFTNETSSSSSKRSKKRKFTQLKEAENLLLNERVHLKRELASIHVTLNEQRATSDKLKRIKFDLNTKTMAAESSRTNRADSVLSMDDPPGVVNSTQNQNSRCFILPDLNMMPSEDEVGTIWN